MLQVLMEVIYTPDNIMLLLKVILFNITVILFTTLFVNIKKYYNSIYFNL